MLKVISNQAEYRELVFSLKNNFPTEENMMEYFKIHETDNELSADFFNEDKTKMYKIGYVPEKFPCVVYYNFRYLEEHDLLLQIFDWSSFKDLGI